MCAQRTHEGDATFHYAPSLGTTKGESSPPKPCLDLLKTNNNHENNRSQITDFITVLCESPQSSMFNARHHRYCWCSDTAGRKPVSCLRAKAQAGTGLIGNTSASQGSSGRLQAAVETVRLTTALPIQKRERHNRSIGSINRLEGAQLGGFHVR